MNIDIFGISELKWMGMGGFNSDDHYIYYCGQESLRRNGEALYSQQESEMQYLVAISKMTEMICIGFQGKPFKSQYSKSMPQPVMLKKLKLTSSVKT